MNAKHTNNETTIRELQRRMNQRGENLVIDGWGGRSTRAAMDIHLPARGPEEAEPIVGDIDRRPVGTVPAAPMPGVTGIPADTDRALTAAYGPPGVQGGREPDLVWFEFPYPMRLYSRTGQVITRHRAHRLAAPDLQAILGEIAGMYTIAEIEELGLHIFGGIYNPRRRTGGSRMSTHAWGIAIDLDPARNGYGLPWAPEHAARPGRPATPGWASMPHQVVQLFERFGWRHGARWRTADAMHAERTTGPA